MHDLVKAERVKLGHFGSPCHPALEARRGVAMLLEISQHLDIVRPHMCGLRELCIAREVSRSSSGKVILN